MCLRSIFAQKYPGKVEVIVVDGGSVDRTLEKAKRFPVWIIETSIKNPELAKLLAFEKSTGDVFFYLDDDNELTSPDWLKKMVYPLVCEPTIVGSFTHHTAFREDSAVTRYLSYDKLQRDPLLRYFSVGIEETFVEYKKDYIVCEFSPNKIPPVGLVLYRRRDVKSLLKTEQIDRRRIFDIDLPATFVKHGYTRFAYVPVGIRHMHANNMLALIKKRVITVKRAFLPTYPSRKFIWFSIEDKRSLTKILKWLFLANSIIPLTISGIKKYMRYKDRVLLLEPLIGLVLTDTVLFVFIFDRKGRLMIGKALTTILFGR
jgi:glycosyltransferase involved in cell wall biosynthesis